MKLKKNKILRLVLIVGAILAFVLTSVIVFGFSLLQAPDSTNNQLERFVIAKGEPVALIGDKLKKKNLIKNSYVFKIYYQLNQDNFKIQAGSFELSPAMDVATILEILSDGTDDIWITFPEGMRREEIAQSLEKYSLINYNQEEFLAQTVALEGQLFPDTYLVPKEVTTQALINLMQNTFEKKIASLQTQIEQSNYSFNELLTMASILEREARGSEQLQQVSNILWKRLEIGMPLQVDATLQYAKGYDETIGSWWATPLAEDKQLNSRFNTYLNPGLPPRPICNPGLEAITASLNPRSTEYLFYIHDKQGNVHFARTLEEHNNNINRYLR